jgi:hypothetical protein
VGVGTRGQQLPVLVIELRAGISLDDCERELLQRTQSHDHTRAIRQFLAHPRLPVDVRHNAKINRELLAAWATKQLSRRSPRPAAPSP